MASNSAMMGVSGRFEKHLPRRPHEPPTSGPLSPQVNTDELGAQPFQEPWLSVHEAARMCGLTVNTLRAYRDRPGSGPKSQIVAGRLAYLESDIQEWMEQRDRKAEARAQAMADERLFNAKMARWVAIHRASERRINAHYKAWRKAYRAKRRAQNVR